jgi:Tol biopolymer transport system component
VQIINPPDTVNLQSLLERPLAWSADSRHLYYLNDKGGTSNIFRIATDGTNKTEQVTKFPTGRIFDFSLAPDEKRAVVARGSVSSDVVIFKKSL